MDKIARIKDLIRITNEASQSYYVKDNPIMTDKEYDLLYDELIQLEFETQYILSNSPTQKVQGEILPYLKKVQHTEPMLSAEKSKDINDIIKFMGDQDCIISWKLDGLTIVLRYNNGKLQQAITRGGGFEGEDVTHTVKQFTNVPLEIEYKRYLEIRGEGLVAFKEFERINAELITKGEEPYSSPRNLAAGSVRQLDSNITKQRNLIFISFGIVKCDEIFSTKVLQFQFLESLGFEVVFYGIIDKSVIYGSIDLFKEGINTLPYLTDGLIIEYNNIEYGKMQGVTGHHSKNMFAFKWSDDSYETMFRGVELNATRTGMVSLTALFDTVDVDGVNVSRATLHNYDIFENLQLGVSDIIQVYRANAVIPEIEDNLTRSGTYKIDMICPSCGGKIVIKQPKEARFLFCENLNCSAQQVQKFVHFVSRDAMNVEGLSEATLEKFINAGFIKEFGDIYKLQQHEWEIKNMEGFGLKSYDRLINAIEKSKDVEMANFIYALGIDQVGQGGSKRLAKYFNNDMGSFLIALQQGFDFSVIEDFGQITNDAIYGWWNSKNSEEIYNLISIVNIKKAIKNNNTVDLTEKIFVVTGSFTNFQPRKKLEDLIERLGGKLTGSISAKTSYLITNDTGSGSKKNQDAVKYGVPIMNENDFMKMVGMV